MMINLANELIYRGYDVDVVLERPEGEFFDKTPSKARLISLSPKDTIHKPQTYTDIPTRTLARRIISRIWKLIFKDSGIQYQCNTIHYVLSGYVKFKLSSKDAFSHYLILSKLPYLVKTHTITQELCKYLMDEQPETVITGLEEQNFRLVIASQLTESKARIILSVRNHLTTFFPLYYSRQVYKHFPWAINKLYPKAYRVVAVSKEIERDLIENFGVPVEKITVIYNPVVNHEIKLRMNETTTDDDWLRSDIPVVLGIGRLHPQKGFDTLLMAFSMVAKERNARLMILGAGREEENLKKIAKELSLNQRVRFPGFRENPFPYMKHCAVFVLSSVNEGLPGVLVQAMACGCPVVATDCRSGPREILEDGKLGELVPVGDPHAMYKAIMASINGRTDTTKLKERSQYFNAQRSTDQYLQLIKTD